MMDLEAFHRDLGRLIESNRTGWDEARAWKRRYHELLRETNPELSKRMDEATLDEEIRLLREQG